MDKDQIVTLQKAELEILKSFIDICEKLNLKYYIVGGTLIGAIRHKGFIPWDDDIDVDMPRKDYEIFISKAQELLPPEYFLQTYITDPEYPANFAKIRNSNTTFIEASCKNRKMNHGVYIDVFPIDYYPEKGATLFEIKKLIYTLRISYAFTSDEGMKMKTKMVKAFSKLLCPTLKGAIKRREKLFTSVKESEKVVNNSGAWGQKEILPISWFGEGKTAEFEGIKVVVPKEYDKMLTHIYGDYMQLPPEEEREPHHYVDGFDLTTPYTEYLKKV